MRPFTPAAAPRLAKTEGQSHLPLRLSSWRWRYLCLGTDRNHNSCYSSSNFILLPCLPWQMTQMPNFASRGFFQILAEPLAPHLPTSISPHPSLRADPRGQASAASLSPPVPAVEGAVVLGQEPAGEPRHPRRAPAPGCLPGRLSCAGQQQQGSLLAAYFQSHAASVPASPGLRRSEGRDEFSPSYQPPQCFSSRANYS